MDLPGLIRALGPDLPPGPRARLTAAWTPQFAEKGRQLACQGQHAADEILVLDGRVVSLITDAEGRGVCVGFCVGPAIVAPQISRTRDGVSLVTLQVAADATLARMPAQALLDMMLESADIREWANGILRDELSRKTDREWCLAALGGADRLAWFRDRYPDHEAQFPHSLIASYLGMTPVSFSRLRAAGQAQTRSSQPIRSSHNR